MKIADWKYMTKDLAVLPYSPGSPVYVDGMLSTLYYATKDQGRIEATFCGDSPNHDEFVRSFDPAKKVLQILCEVKADERIIPVGYAWVEMPKGGDGNRAALCGFCFIKRSRHMIDLGTLGIYYWIDGLKLSVIHGVQLGSNISAMSYASKLGFDLVAKVPFFHYYRGDLVDACVMTLTSDKFWACNRARLLNMGLLETSAY
jgi:hypothetical protein